ncbi:MAG: DTW domain-containing protein [Planctomycetes bacterium]|nr:DTW domain-containing protein [Planctomycetota bacterium]
MNDPAPGAATAGGGGGRSPGESTRSGRRICPRCRRPTLSCLCAHLVPVPTAVELVFLQHAREAKRPIGTAWLTHLALPGSRILVGVDFADRPEVHELLAQRRRRPLVLYPGEGSRDLAEYPPGELPAAERTLLLVPDGTWWEAAKLLRVNPWLAALQRVAVRPAGPSRFVLRRQRTAVGRATLEAVALALSTLEGAPERFERLLGVLDALATERDSHLQSGAGNRRGRARRERRGGARHST